MNNEEVKKLFFYNHGIHYDLQYSWLNEDIPFYLSLIKEYGEPVLELACGTGRITIPISKENISITGLDINENLINYARKKASVTNQNLNFIHSDCCDFSLIQKYNFIFLPFSSVHHINLDELEKCLQCVKNHLYKDGIFLVDLFNPNLKILSARDEDMEPFRNYPDPEGRGIIYISENSIYDRSTQINYITWFYKLNEIEWKDEFKLRIYYPQEIFSILKYNGFEIIKNYGSYAKEEFTHDSSRNIILCKQTQE